jgi:protein-glucosylgalactosylhydroxylysine glucosidase
MHISGVFNGETTSPSHRAAIPASFAVTISNSITSGVLLDVEEGIYRRRGKLQDSAATYELRWYAHRSTKSLYIMELEVQLNGESSATLQFSSNTLKTSPDFNFEPIEVLGEATLRCGSTTIPETEDGPTHRVCVAADTVPATLTVKESKTIVFVSALRSSLDVAQRDRVDEVAVTDYKYATGLVSRGALYPQHVQAWAQVWESGIEVRGRPDVATAVNASMFAILSSVRDDWAYGLAPGGLTNYYNGHSFWDTETWMYPPLLFLQPKIARSLIDYRFARMEGAQRKAKSYSPPFAGTMYPWESAFSGVETCPTFAATGLREDHISGDIAFAIWQDWQLSQDKRWLQDVGYPMLVGIADFWVSRSVYDEKDQKYHIRDIIPPDEYVDHVNDSVYSNFVASLALKYTVQAAQALNATCDSCAKYQEISNNLVILFDEQQRIHPEYEGYPGDLVKQADVVLLHYPLGLEMPEDVRRNDLEYYSARTDVHGPAMTWGMHSIGYLDLQDYKQAAQYFNMSFQDNMHAPLQVWTETVSVFI